MSDVNIQLVREFFELNQFSILTHWPHADERARGGDGGALLFAQRLGMGQDGAEAPPFHLRGDDLHAISRAAIEVRAWHADKFYPSVIEASPILGHVASREVAELAGAVFGGSPYTTILVISELPSKPGPRERSLEMLAGLGMGHVLEFGTLLGHLAARLSSQGNYGPSPTLQTLRLMKRYGLLRRQQLEFSFAPEPPPPENAPAVDTDLARSRHVFPPE